MAALSIGWAGATTRAQTLGIGDTAPKLEVKSFVKGEPVKAFEPGKNYVVEFWATWCGPCKVSIPHLTELQKKHPEVAFIGVSVFENDQSLVEPFVKEMGDKMDYRVALDSVPEGKGRGDGVMGKTWMEAAGQEGIPTAFIINKESKIAWIGHPMEMEKPLDKVIEGTWDLKTAAEEGRKKKEKQAAMQKLIPKLQSLPAFLKRNQQDKALEVAKEIQESEIGDEPTILNFIAWTIIDPQAGFHPSEKLVKLALEMAKKADEKTDQKEGAIADTLAKAYFDSGDAAKALETQQRAVRLMKESGQPVPADVTERLDQYKKAVDEK
jgi:thiol-disulfide isomerase/thioredoxin